MESGEISSISNLLEEVRKTLDIRGYDATVTLLRNARHNTSCDQTIQFVVVSVCNALYVSIEHLINNKISDDHTKYAKAFIIYYLRKDFRIEWNIIKHLLKHKDQSWLWQLMNLIRNLKPRLAADAQWLLVKEKLDKVMKDYKAKFI